MSENKRRFDYATLGLLSPILGGRNYTEMMILKRHSDRASVFSRINLNPWCFCYFCILHRFFQRC